MIYIYIYTYISTSYLHLSGRGPSPLEWLPNERRLRDDHVDPKIHLPSDALHACLISIGDWVRNSPQGQALWQKASRHATRYCNRQRKADAGFPRQASRSPHRSTGCTFPSVKSAIKRFTMHRRALRWGLPGAKRQSTNTLSFTVDLAILNGMR